MRPRPPCSAYLPARGVGANNPRAELPTKGTRFRRGLFAPAGGGGKSVTSFVCLGIVLTSLAQAQIPRINTLFPIGGKAGSTVEVEIRGSSLTGAEVLMSSGPGVSGTVQPGGAKVDETNKPLWQGKCGSCHELRSPANRSMTPAQWAATVERMVKVRQAPLAPDEAEKVSQYLQSAARAGRVTAQIKIAPDVLPGLYELRVVTPRGVSTACPFEVGNLPEVMGANCARDQALPVTLPCVANGSLSGNGERHFYKFSAKKGQRLVYNLKAYRYSDASQMYFYPNLRLYDSEGKQIVENHGYYELDPLIDWTCPADGEYTLEARDLLGRGNPASVYRLTMGVVPYDTMLFPPAGQAATRTAVNIIGKNTEGMPTSYTMDVPPRPGVTTVGSPCGPEPFFVTPYPIVRDDSQLNRYNPTTAPAGFAGRISQAGESDTFYVTGQGTYEFEGFAARLGSPTRLRVSLLKKDGKRITGFERDGHMAAMLDPAQTFALKVEDADGKGGAEYVYFIEARPAPPIIAAVCRPDNVTVRPGTSVAVNVILTRREGVQGDVTVTAQNLPPGVTAEPVVIQPDRDEAWLILTAVPDAKPGEQPIDIIARAQGAGAEVRAPAIPQEEYRLNNQPRYAARAQCVLAVRGQPDFDGAIESEAPIRVHPKKGVEVKIKIRRREGFKGNVTVFMQGLPAGWVASPEECRADKDTVTMTVRPDGRNPTPFLKRDPKLTPICAVVEAASDEFRFVIGTIPVARADRIDDEEK